MKQFAAELRIAILATIVLAAAVCGVYPFVVWGLAEGLFPSEAAGSLITRGGEVLGSRLIAQGFTGPGYFHPRPSAAGAGWDAMRSGGSNRGPTSRTLVDEVARRVADYRAENALAPGVLIPADAVTASASGLDPHISVRNAELQAPRVAAARGLGLETVIAEVARCTSGRDLGLFGEPRVNVNLLNKRLDELRR